MATLLLLPVEIIDLMVGWLSNDDLPSLRSFCRTTAAWTNDRFARAFFHTRRVMMEQRSLEALDMISKHAILGPSVKTLEIFVCHLVSREEVDVLCPSISRVDYQKSNKQKEHNCINETEYAKHFSSQENILQTGLAATCLTEVMKRLSHCDKINVRDVASCFPWGWNRLQREIGAMPERTLEYLSDRSVQFVRHVLHAVFTAIEQSNVQAETLQISIGDEFGMSTCINPSMLVGLDLAPMMQIRNLALCLLPGVPDCGSPSDENGTWATELNQFFQLMPGLSKLELKSECCSDMDHKEWFSGVCYKARIPKLESLRLQLLNCYSHEMAYFLLRHRKTLRHIDFEFVELNDGTPDVSWYRLIKKIQPKMAQDTYIRISRCVGETYFIHDGTNLPETMEAKGTEALTDILSMLSTPGLWTD